VRRKVGTRTGQGEENKNLVKVRRNERTRTGQGKENKNLVKVRRNEGQELVKVKKTRTQSR
jgi:hypothetical protein